MSFSWIKIIIAVVIGAVLGLTYGWWIEPVEYTDVTPNTLRADYQADYVLMVAEAFQTEQNADVAARRLAVMTSEAPSILLANTLDYARLNGFTPNEILLLQNLLLSMQTYQPQGNIVP